MKLGSFPKSENSDKIHKPVMFKSIAHKTHGKNYKVKGFFFVLIFFPTQGNSVTNANAFGQHTG